MKYLQKNFSVVASGSAEISSKYLRECLKDEGKQQKLFENLQAAEKNFESLEKGQTMKIKIDGEGNMIVESSKTTVTFNESKRKRQLAAAKTFADVQFVMNLLQTDLEECEEGVKNNWCDEEEVKKVKAMIECAKQTLQKVSGEKKSSPENFSSEVTEILF